MKTTPRGQRVLQVVVGILLLNFFQFAGVSLAIGGTALNGKVENGIYYLGEHGHYKEVSAALYYYSLGHGITVFGMGFVLFITVLRLMWSGDLEL